MLHQNHRMAIATLAILCAAVFGLVNPARAQQNPSDQRAGQRTEQMRGATGSQAGGFSLPQGITQKSVDRTDVDKAIASATEAALTKGKFDDFADHFVDQDADRIKSAKINTDDLDRALDQFDNQWKAKYGEGFKIRNRDQAYGQFVSVIGGEISDPTALSSNWPVSPTGPSSRMSTGQAGGNAKLDKGRDVAIATLQPVSGSEQPLHLSLQHETLKGWKFSLPASVNANDLKSSLLRHVDELNRSASQWPSDVNQAERYVTYHVFLATYTAGQQGGMGGSSQGGMSSGTEGSSQGGSQGMQPQGGQTGSQGSEQQGTQPQGAQQQGTQGTQGRQRY